MRRIAHVLISVLFIASFASCSEEQLSVASPANTISISSPGGIPSPVEATGDSMNTDASTPEGTSAPAGDADSPQAEVPATPSAMFSKEDWSMLGVALGASEEEVISTLGEPERRETYYSPSLEEDVIALYYDFGSITILSFGVDSICINRSEHAGVRGIQIGNSPQDVLNEFPGTLSDMTSENSEYYIYGEPYSEQRAFVGKGADGGIEYMSFVFGGQGTVPVCLKINFTNECASSIILFLSLV